MAVKVTSLIHGIKTTCAGIGYVEVEERSAKDNIPSKVRIPRTDGRLGT